MCSCAHASTSARAEELKLSSGRLMPCFASVGCFNLEVAKRLRKADETLAEVTAKETVEPKTIETHSIAKARRGLVANLRQQSTDSYAGAAADFSTTGNIKQ